MPAQQLVPSRRTKKVAVVVYDTLMVPVAVYLALALRLGDWWPSFWIEPAIPLTVFMLVVSLALSLALRIPALKISALDTRGQGKLAVSALTLALVGTLANLVYFAGVPRTVPAIFGIVYMILLVGGRVLATALIKTLYSRGQSVMRVAIYGAGAAGIQLHSAFRQTPEVDVVAMVDDNPHLHNVIIGGLRVERPETLADLASRGQIDRILISMPSVPRARQQQIADSLDHLACDVMIAPGYVEIMSQGSLVNTLQPVASADLLGRNEVDLDIPDVQAAFDGKSVMVTGAGGSIGSELSRQLMDCAPRRVVLFDHSEFALFQIERELRPVAAERGIHLVAVLGSVCDRGRVDATLEALEVCIIVHAAAYKHVPLVEANSLEGVRNNVIGTRTLAEAASRARIERFILVSTDKAVRPTNVMGGTKRMAEIVIQDLQRRSPETKFTMVRFGNVLESSGSVVPIFREQIAAGGPVTVTHPEMTRYFMTVPEASRLVLLAGSFARGGEVFVLDMGDPVKIADMARRMIELSAMQVRDKTNPGGDIEIIFTGIRPGEKLYEELLIGDGMLATPHPKIRVAAEEFPTAAQVAEALDNLQNAVTANAPEVARQVLADYAMVGPQERARRDAPLVAAQSVHAAE